MDLISKHNIVHRYEKRSLLIAINCVAGLAIFFFGYDQGMMGSVNVSIDYGVYRMKFGDVELHDGANQVTVQNSTLQGGIVRQSPGMPSRGVLMVQRSLSTTSVPSLAVWWEGGLVRRLAGSKSWLWERSGASSEPACRLLP